MENYIDKITGLLGVELYNLDADHESLADLLEKYQRTFRDEHLPRFDEGKPMPPDVQELRRYMKDWLEMYPNNGYIEDIWNGKEWNKLDQVAYHLKLWIKMIDSYYPAPRKEKTTVYEYETELVEEPQQVELQEPQQVEEEPQQAEEPRERAENIIAKHFPSDCRTEAIGYFDKAKEKGLIDENWHWRGTKVLLAEFCSLMSYNLHLGKGNRNSWKPFEELFSVRGLASSSYDRNAKSKKDPEGIGKVYEIFK